LDDGTGFWVEDDGPGFPTEKCDQVFDQGFSTAGEGTGLGLSIVRELAIAHGWQIIAMEGRDGGARFEIRGTGVE